MRHLTYANVVSTLALFVVLGGTSYAVTQLPANSVGTRQLKRSAVSSVKLKKDAVTTVKVKNGSLLAGDFRAGQLPVGATGPAGPVGPRGGDGAAGPAGATGLTGYNAVVLSSASDTSQSKSEIARCPAGKTAISGGYTITQPVYDGSVVVDLDRASAGAAAGSGWFVAAHNTNAAESWQLTVTAYCVKLTDYVPG